MTKLLYLEDHGLLINEAVVVSVTEENGKHVVVLDQTVFYPQGGGQPYDTGTITAAGDVFKVEEVRFVDGIVKHIGTFAGGSIPVSFAEGQTVTCEVDKERRELHCRLHSAGHVLDIALHKLGINWIPGKGFHFPQGPYVEYTGGTLEGVDVEKLRADLETKCNEIVNQGASVTLRFMPKEEMSSVCSFVPEYIPAGKPARVVMYGDIGIPCGGTHVSNLKDIKGMTIRKIKKEKENIRISYDIVNS